MRPWATSSKGIDKLGWDIPIIGNTSVSATGLISTEPPTGVLGTNQVKNLVMHVYKSTAYDADAAPVVDAVTRMKALGEIKANLIVGYNFDAPLLVQKAVEKAGSTDPEKVAEALEDPEVQEAAPTAILSTYNFTAEQHDSSPLPTSSRSSRRRSSRTASSTRRQHLRRCIPRRVGPCRPDAGASPERAPVMTGSDECKEAP